MFLIIGLGNPGKKYQATRHNVGFAITEKFAEKNNFPAFELSKKFNALVSEITLKNEKIILALPQTFMNNSGESAFSLSHFYKIYPQNIIIIHDDIDLPLGKIKISLDRGSAGHRGIESIIQKLGTKEFVRIRIGILPDKNKKPEKPEKFVLKKFTKKESELLESTVKQTVNALDLFFKGGIEKAMNKYN